MRVELLLHQLDHQRRPAPLLVLGVGRVDASIGNRRRSVPAATCSPQACSTGQQQWQQGSDGPDDADPLKLPALSLFPSRMSCVLARR